MYPNFTDEEVEAIYKQIPEDVLKGPRGMRQKYSRHNSGCNRDNRASMEFTFEQWAAFWWASGHWNDRGQRKGCYQMCRKDDTGPYAMGNVRIDTKEANLAERKWDNPVIATCKSTGFETEYKYPEEAARQLNVNSGHISEAAHGERKSAYGYTWRFK